MTKLSWFIVAALIAAGLVSVYINRNANSDLRPYLGKWTGGFVVQMVDGKPAGEAAKRESLSGFLQIYGSNKKFELQLSGEQQDLTIKGTWALEKETRLVLNAGSIDIQDFGGSEKRDPNLAYIPNEAVRDAYEKPIILDLSADKQKLTGLLSSIGRLSGAHEFTRVGSGR